MNPRFRERNTLLYRTAHWPIWIFVFGIALGPFTFELFEQGLQAPMAVWLAVVAVCTGAAGLRGRLPGVEPQPYILRFTEDKPNPLYRRVCYTVAWSGLIAFAVLNLAGLAYAAVTGVWRLRQVYEVAYFPLAGAVWICGGLGWLPRVRPSTKGEGSERRYFYGALWAVATAEAVLGLLWKTLGQTRENDVVKLIVFAGVLVAMGFLARSGKLPRTRAVTSTHRPGAWAISD